jgi:uncharacterized protein YjbK
MTDNTYEIETKLVIFDKDPKKIANQIALEKNFGNYILESAPDQIIRDRYFDTAGHFLRSKGLAFRFRALNNENLLTLKGNSRIQAGGAIRRMEIEDRWNERTLNEILQILSYIGLTLKFKAKEFIQSDPLITLNKLGFILLQERTTHRQIRIIKNPENSLEKAEMAIDKAIYQFQNHNLKHYEVEMEEKSELATGMIEQCITIIHSSYPNTLKSWKINKLVLGLVLEKLVQNPEFHQNIASDGHISSKGYQLIEEEARIFFNGNN